MVQIDIGTINIQIVSQAGSVNIGNTLNVVEKPSSPSPPGQDREPEGVLSPDQRSTGRVKEPVPAASRRRGGGDSPSRLQAFPPGMVPPFVPVPGWIPVPLPR